MTVVNQFKNGVKWSVVGQFSTLFFEFVFGVVLARILSPSDFGLIAIVSVFIIVSQIFINSGMIQSLVRDHSVSEIDYSTIFFLNIIIGFGAYLMLFIFAPTISSYYNLPQISLLIRIIGLSLIISSLSIVYRAILTKNLRFKTINNITIISSIISGIAAVFFAFNGAGVWSLIFKTIANNLITLFLLVTATSWFPKLVFSKSSLFKHWSFGKNLLVSGLIGWIYKDVFALMLGRIISIDFLGFYNRSEMMRNLVTNNMESVITKPSYPVLAGLQNDKEAFLGLTVKTLKFSFLIVGLTLAFVCSSAEPLIEFILGVKWLYSAEILKYLSLCGLVMPLSSIMINAISVSGRSDLYLKLQIYYSIYVLSTLFFAYILGVNAFLYSLVASNIISYVHTTFVFQKIYDYSLYDQLKDLKNKIFIISVTIISLSVIRFFLKDSTAFTNLIILVPSFFILILLYFKISKDKEITSIYNSLFSICKSRNNLKKN